MSLVRRWGRGERLGATSGTTSGTIGGTATGANNADNSTVGDSNGMSLPAVLDEVISVTGVYSFPYDLTPASPPVPVTTSVYQITNGPVFLLGTSATLGGTGGTNGSSSTGGTTTATGYDANAQLLAAADFEIYANRIVGSVNRSDVTDFAAPALNVPTFRRVRLGTARDRELDNFRDISDPRPTPTTSRSTLSGRPRPRRS